MVSKLKSLLIYKKFFLILAIIVVLAGVAYLSIPKFGLHPQTAVASQANLTATDPCVSETTTNKYNCYDAQLTSFLDKYGATSAQGRLSYLIQTSDYIKSQCHPLAHSLGRHAFHFYGSVPAATKYATEVCWSGYYHGVMEAYMSNFSDTKLLASMPTICTQTPGKPYSFDYYNCVHGLGHGVTIRFNNDIFKALPYCQAIGQTWEEQSCFSGVFMQNIVVDGVSHQSVNIKASDPVYPCNAVMEIAKEPCYLMVTSNILKTVSYDYSKAFKICDGVESAYIHTCYQSMGRDISGDFLLDPVSVVSYCSLGNSAFQANCYIGAAKNAVFNDRNTVKAVQLCNITPTQYQPACNQALSEAAATI